MTEYDIFLPSTYGDGTPVDPQVVERIKRTLFEAFGGYTHLRQRSEGAWRMGGVEFREEVTILRVLDDGHAGFDMAGFRRSLEETLRQDAVLIIQREVSTV